MCRKNRKIVELYIITQKKTCIQYLYMVYFKSGQENTVYTVRQANEISFERNLKKELAKLVWM
ncbi:hypothetical protein BK136_14545 [Paenibacillus amylolyticus]|nr:hypothetical protein BK136_14545 [Paenibacillus amylolyticus]